MKHVRQSPFRTFLFILPLGFFSLLHHATHAQPNAGKVEINCDPKLTQYVEQLTLLNDLKKTVPGYRVQIYSGANRSRATELKNEFYNKYPLVPSYLLYHQPNFRVRVGDFRTRLQAWKFHEQITSSYATSFIVRDDVRYQDAK